MIARTPLEMIWVRFLAWMVFVLILLVRSAEMEQPDYTHFDSWGSVECSDFMPDAISCRTGANGE